MATSESTVMISTEWNPKLAASWAHRNIFLSPSSYELDSSVNMATGWDSLIRRNAVSLISYYHKHILPFRTRIWRSLIDESLRRKFIKSILLPAFLTSHFSFLENFLYCFSVNCSFHITLFLIATYSYVDRFSLSIALTDLLR